MLRSSPTASHTHPVIQATRATQGLATARRPRRFFRPIGNNGASRCITASDIAKLTLFGDNISTLIGEEPPIESWQATEAAKPS